MNTDINQGLRVILLVFQTCWQDVAVDRIIPFPLFGESVQSGPLDDHHRLGHNQ